MKGIILAGGSGTRLYPITKGISKQLMPIFDKPMIFYPLSTLIDAGISEILIITTKKDSENFKDLLGNGHELGCKIEYATQNEPNGIAEAFLIGEKFIGNESVGLILGDNIFYGNDLNEIITKQKDPKGATIFAYKVNDPERYGVVEFNSDHIAVSLEEKPNIPKSDYAVPGLYFFDNTVIDKAKKLIPSERGELEITGINNMYLEERNLNVAILKEGTVWLDTGTIDSMIQASQYVEVIEKRQGIKIGCIEEAAFKKGLISRQQLHALAKPLLKSGYGEYLMKL
ncbi:MAG: glucose-1-phosphate thymidylyltransferase RfbA [Patescibacteria group bacterium]